MSGAVLLLFLRKELSDLRSNRQVWPAFLLLPLLAVLLPVLLLVPLPAFLADLQSGTDRLSRTLMELVAEGSGAIPGATTEERLARLLMRDMVLFYLVMPSILGASSAALALVREKEQRTLEPILATPLRDRDLLLAKLLAAVVPSVVLTWAAALVGAGIGALTAWLRVGVAIFPTGGNLIGILLLAPALTVVAALAALRVSARFTDVPGAMQYTGLVVVPVSLLMTVLVGRPAMRSALAAAAGCLLMAAVAGWLFRRNLRRFRREELLTKWR